MYHSPIFIWLMIFLQDDILVYSISRKGKVLQKVK